MNAGTRLQALWRWNGRPLRIRITRIADGWEITWERWMPRASSRKWRTWRSYVGNGPLSRVIASYRPYAEGWRGRDG